MDAELEAPEQEEKKTETSNDSDGSIDKDAIIAQMGALDDGTIEMLRMFVDMTEPLIEKIKTADNDNFHELKELAHSLKGAARSACANKLGDIAANLQIKAEEKTQAPELIEEISTEFENVKKEIGSL